MGSLISDVLTDLGQLWPWWVSSMLKVTVWLAAGALVDRALRQRSSSLRHVVAVLVALGLPLIFILNLSPRPETDGWKPLTPLWERVAGREEVEKTTALLVGEAVVQASPPHRTANGFSVRLWPGLVVAIWGAGVLAHWIGLVARTWPRRSRGLPADCASDATVVRALKRECRQVGMTREPRLLLIPEGVPRVTGVWRPTIELPAAANEWPEEKLAAVLHHELAHVRRSDLRWLVATEAALALLWGHPLGILLRRRLARLREEACDDAVIASGMEPAAYAAHLASFLCLSTPASRGWGLPAVERLGWLARFRRLLDPSVSRQAIRAWEVAVVSLLAGLIAMVATLNVGCVGSRGPHLAPKLIFSQPPKFPHVRDGEPTYFVAFRLVERLVPYDSAGYLGLPEDFHSINGMVLSPREGWRLFNPNEPSVDRITGGWSGGTPGPEITSAHFVSWTNLRPYWQYGPSKLDRPSGPLRSAIELVSAAKKLPTGFVCGISISPSEPQGQLDVYLDVECKIFTEMVADPETGRPKPMISHQALKGKWTVENGGYILLGVRKEPKPVEVYVPGLRKLPLVGRVFRKTHNEGFLRLAALQIMAVGNKDSDKLMASQFNIPE